MTDTKKIRKTAFVMYIAVSLTLLWVVVSNVRGLVLQGVGGWYGWDISIAISTAVGGLIIFPALIISFKLLHSTKSGISPFNMKNVKRLKTIAVILVVYEPYFHINQWVFNTFHPIVIDGMTFATYSSNSGIVFAAGLVVYCVSLIFEYGISLQQQVDETL